MKKLFLFLLISTTCISNTYTIDFLDISIEEALKKANQENKNVLLYFTADWCGPCKYMEKFTFKNDTVRTYLNDNFIALKINESTSKGEKLVRKFKIHLFPTFIVLNKEGIQQKIFFGRTSTKDFLAQLSNAPVSIRQIEKQSMVADENIRKDFKPKIGLKVGGLSSQISTINSTNRIGMEVDVFLSFENRRFLIRPALGFISVGNNNDKLNYISTSIDFGFTLKKSTIFGLSGGYRIIVSPYYSFLQNSDKQVFNSNDVGLKYGISAFMGSDSKIELQLFGSSGLKDIQTTIDGKQTNQSFGIGCGLTF